MIGIDFKAITARSQGMAVFLGTYKSSTATRFEPVANAKEVETRLVQANLVVSLNLTEFLLTHGLRSLLWITTRADGINKKNVIKLASAIMMQGWSAYFDVLLLVFFFFWFVLCELFKA